jgi:hypothetical protein
MGPGNNRMSQESLAKKAADSGIDAVFSKKRKKGE